jgi:hypothetical protein
MIFSALVEDYFCVFAMKQGVFLSYKYAEV